VGEPTTHYQISLTARQAVGAFAGLLVALGLAFFFGLMAGYSGRERGEAPRESSPADAARPAASADVPPRVETGVEAKSEAGTATAAAAEPTPPATIHPFEDSAEEESAASVAAQSGSRTTVAGSPAESSAPKSTKPAAARPAAAPPDRVWVQAASLSSRADADALGGRLSKHGFHAVVLPGSGPKGKVYRVRVGPYRSEEEASQAVAKLAHQEKIREPWIVPEGK